MASGTIKARSARRWTRDVEQIERIIRASKLFAKAEKAQRKWDTPRVAPLKGRT
jgi:hypothetical protein